MDRVLAQLTENAERQQAHLRSVMDQVDNERAKQAIADAMERWAFRLENARRAVNGERGQTTPPGRPDSTGGPATTQTGRPDAAPAATGRPGAVPAGTLFPSRPTGTPARP